jgi:peroxiredoxin
MFLVLAIACASGFLRAQSSVIGSRVADFQLSDSTGQAHSLQSYAGKVLVLVFWSYKCPVVLAYNDRLIGLRSKYAGKGVIILGVASNSNEAAAEINRNVANLKISFPILIDPEGVLAEGFGATHAPSAFVVDENGRLRYGGAIDNNKKEGSGGREAYVDNAIAEVIAGKAVTVPESKEFGCVIQRKKQ